jgi:hypothetical protein
MPRSADDTSPDHNHAGTAPLAEDEHEFEKFKQGLRKLIAFYRDKLARAEAALGALEGKSTTAEPRLNKTIKDLLAKTGPLTRDEVMAELLRASLVADTVAGRSRVDRSLRQCVNAATLVEQDGKFNLPGNPT